MENIMKHLLAATALSLSVVFAAIPSIALARSPAEEQTEAGKPGKKPVQPGKAKVWKKGANYRGAGQTVASPRSHNLTPPPKGKRWVKDGSDFLLIDNARGIVESVRTGR